MKTHSIRHYLTPKNVLVYVLSACLYSYSYTTPLKTIYGSIAHAPKVVEELLQSQGMQRLKKINQYGISHFMRPTHKPYTRYTHSIGVYYLLNRYNTPLKEQVAGLLHDASHTVFSHVGDHVAQLLQKEKVFDQNSEAYQDSKHNMLLANTDIPAILKRHGFTMDDVNPKQAAFTGLERDLPDLCADRLEYNLYGAYIENWITEQEISDILYALHFDHDTWYFDDAAQAQKFGSLSLQLCKKVFGTPWNYRTYDITAKALLSAATKGNITINEINYGQDNTIFAILQTCERERMTHLSRLTDDSFEQASAKNHDFTFKAKFRGIDPLIKTNKGLKRLTTIDPSYKAQYNDLKDTLQAQQYWKKK